MKKVGITGQNGFVGWHLYQSLKLYKEEFTLIDFERGFFEDEEALDTFVTQCDVIVHLAALNRHNDPEVIYAMNTGLVKRLVAALERTQSQAHIIISSSTQEERENPYGKSKKEGRLLLSEWAKQSGGRLTGMVIPNVFGPFGLPYYNSVVATFCHQVSHNETPKIDVDGQLKLIYVGELVEEIIKAIRTEDNTHELQVPHTAAAKVSEILGLLKHYREVYQERGEFPILNNSFELKLFNTYRCYMDIPNYFPRKFVQHTDNRGAFVEIARHGIAGQTSFSTTVPGITRGNHFHTRKIERFAVIKGKALIQLRRIGTDEVHNFYLDGDQPAYVDMPIWYTHNIKNIGEDTLYTIFWINEPYDASDPDTWFETV
ncbi:NAD-dependent epimerase/dehydratase family protein [Cecembia calidifontis]|uniref:UDP-2-acetamido-2,6-beta-L-arabino-hexul-4-ose reductase n=1 Tax=Cecembia calidifontis TaxID=1187080 RepID=A0A4Q7PF76_9BACT|nr:NAD-dependent epimerase/dehydratase family protein [Cecembia calidifontis]RZS98468.1 UDP-2-acetamido-2,6-beta-L-arabino-hexul-4-ose reductase [Cecembia calidifontis]